MAEYWLLRFPFSLHLGWIVAASVVNINVQADAARASPGQLLALAVSSYAVVAAVATVFTFVFRRPDPVACLVLAWALAGVSAELGNPSNLNNPTRLNPHSWDEVTLHGLRGAANIVSIAAIGLACCGLWRLMVARRTALDKHQSQLGQGRQIQDFDGIPA